MILFRKKCGLNINFFVICWLDLINCFLKNLNDNDISFENEVGI